MAKYPEKQIGQYKGPGWNVAPPSAGAYVAGAGAQDAQRAAQFAGLSQSIAGLGAQFEKEQIDEDVAEGQRRVIKDGEAAFRKLEADGKLDWTPAMMRGANTTSGKLAGQEFNRQYQMRWQGMSIEERSNPESARELYDTMLAEHHMADRDPNTYYDDGFNAVAASPESTGRALMTSFSSAAAQLAKSEGIKSLGLLVGNTTQEALKNLVGLDPSSAEYKDQFNKAIDSLQYELNIIANGTGEVTDSGTIDTGAYGAGFWTANNGEGAVTFVKNALLSAAQSNHDPRIVLEALENIKVGTGNLTDIPDVRAVIRESLMEGGAIDSGVKAWKTRVTRNREKNFVEYNTTDHAIKLAAGNGDIAKVRELSAIQEERISNLFFDDEQYDEIEQLREYELNVLDFHEDKARIAQEKLLEKNKEDMLHHEATSRAANMVTEHFTGKVDIANVPIMGTSMTMPVAVTVPGIASLASAIDVPDKRKTEAWLTSVVEETGLKRTEVKTIVGNKAKDILSELATNLFNNNDLTGGMDKSEYIKHFVVNFTNNYNEALGPLTQYYQDLYQMLQQPEADLDAIFRSKEGMMLTGIVMAGVRMQELGLLGSMTETGSGTGNDIQNASRQIVEGKESAYDVEQVLRDIIRTEGAGRPMSDIEQQAKYPTRAYGDIDRDAIVMLGDYRTKPNLIFKELGEANPSLDVSLLDWQEDAIRGEVFDRARTLAQSNQYTMESAMRKTVQDMAKVMTITTSDNGNGFHIADKGKHPWTAEFMKGDGMDNELLQDFADFVKDTLFLSEDRLDQRMEITSTILSQDRSEYRGLSPADRTRAVEEARLGGALKDLGIQQDFRDSNVIFTADNNGHIWFSSGGDELIPNTGHMTNAEMEALLPAFRDYQRTQVMSDTDKITVKQYQAGEKSLNRRKERDATYGIKRENSLSDNTQISRIIRGKPFPAMVTGGLPSPHSENIKDKKVYDALFEQLDKPGKGRVIWHDPNANKYYFNGNTPSPFGANRATPPVQGAVKIGASEQTNANGRTIFAPTTREEFDAYVSSFKEEVVSTPTPVASDPLAAERAAYDVPSIPQKEIPLERTAIEPAFVQEQKADFLARRAEREAKKPTPKRSPRPHQGRARGKRR